MAGRSASILAKRCGPRSCRVPPARIARCDVGLELPEPARHRAKMRARLALPLGEALRLPDLELETLADEDRRVARCRHRRGIPPAARCGRPDRSSGCGSRRRRRSRGSRGPPKRSRRRPRRFGDRLPAAARRRRRSPAGRAPDSSRRRPAPSRASTARNGAGTDTRPFWSSRFANVATKPSIAPRAGATRRRLAPKTAGLGSSPRSAPNRASSGRSRHSSTGMSMEYHGIVWGSMEHHGTPKMRLANRANCRSIGPSG